VLGECVVAGLGTRTLRVLAVPYGHALSHVSRPLEVAKELRKRGHEVVFAGGGRQLRHVEEAGFPAIRDLEMPHEVLFGRIRERKLRFILEGELRTLVDEDLRVIREVRPDLVLTDGRISARLSTRAAGVPHAAIVNVSSTHHRAVPYVPVFGWVRPTWLRSLANRFNLWAEMAVFDRANPAFGRVARRLGLPPDVTATNCLEGNDLTLLPDLPELMPSQGLPPGHHYVGPITFDGSHLPDPPWWSELLLRKESGARVVYFTLGTTGTRELFRSALRDLGGRDDLAVVVSTGGQVDLPAPPANVFVAEVLDGDRVMELADVVVCHGGNGTIYQALRHGVYVLGIPAIPDQEYNLRRAEALGIGARVHSVDLAGPGFLSRMLSSKKSEEVLGARGGGTGARFGADGIVKLLGGSAQGQEVGDAEDLG